MKELAINDNYLVSQKKEIVAADMDGETVMISIENGKYYAIDTIGSRIWELLAFPRSMVEVVRILREEYDVEYGQCQADVLEFLNYLRQEGLINLD